MNQAEEESVWRCSISRNTARRWAGRWSAKSTDTGDGPCCTSPVRTAASSTSRTSTWPTPLHPGSSRASSWSCPSTRWTRRPGRTPMATLTGASAGMSSGCTISWTKLSPSCAICPRSATAGMTCPASSPSAAASARPMRSTFTSAGPTSSAAVWPSAASTPPTTASATTWMSWCI